MNKIKIQFLVGFLCAFGMAGCMPSKTQTITRSTTTAVVDRVSRYDVDMVFGQARTKGRLQAVYQRALDQDPALRGKVVVRLKIKSNGTVASASIVSSELNNKALEHRFLTIISGMEFGEGDFEEWDNTYTLYFIPL